MSETFYRPGLVFHSPFSAYQYVVRPKVTNYGPDGITPVSEIRELLAEFATHRGEYTYTDHDGLTQVAADIAGHFFDLDSQAEQKSWTDQEKELVANRLLKATEKFPGEIQLYTKKPAAKPWPKYDDAHHNTIPVLADQLGLVAEALLYERENKNRGSVVEKLEELQNAAPDVEAADEILTAA